MDKPLQDIAHLIRKKNGLLNNSIGNILIDTSIKQRMNACNISNINEYHEHIKENTKEFNELIEASIVSETWFFRESKIFNNVLDNIKKQLLINNQSIFKILCIPCSTGEEPYSLAMLLTENKISNSNYLIDAIDISKKSLIHAKQGLYHKNSFREKTHISYQDKYFYNDKKTYQLKDNIKETVTFYQHNILDIKPDNHTKYDAILCRNLLIYFDEETKHIALKNLTALLQEGGQLFVGHAEFGCIPKNLFSHIKQTHGFGIKNQTTSPKSINTNNTPIKKITKNTKHSKKDSTLIKAKKLADLGEFKKAKILCEKHTSSHGNSCESFYLLGLISHSQKDTNKAELFFKKCLYLDPAHYESLIFLSLIMEKKGELENSTRLKRRANGVIKN